MKGGVGDAGPPAARVRPFVLFVAPLLAARPAHDLSLPSIVPLNLTTPSPSRSPAAGRKLLAIAGAFRSFLRAQGMPVSGALDPSSRVYAASQVGRRGHASRRLAALCMTWAVLDCLSIEDPHPPLPSSSDEHGPRRRSCG